MSFKIAGRPIGPEHPCLTVAEIGSNHGGSKAEALRLIGLAADCEADAVKFQSFSAAGLVVRWLYDGDGKRRENPAFAALERFALPLDWHGPLKEEAERRGLIFLSTPFDGKRLAFLAELGVAAIKIASGDLTHLELIERAAHVGKPILLSTGMASGSEVERAVRCVFETGNRRLVLMHCVSQYPSRMDEMNLRVLANRLSLPSALAAQPVMGLSDHSPGHEGALAARALGACVIEKHFTVSREAETPDASFALEPDEFRDMVRALRRLEQSLGTGIKVPTNGELEESHQARRSICAACHIPPGVRLERTMVKFRRPGTGLPPTAWVQISGKLAAREIQEDEILEVAWFE